MAARNIIALFGFLLVAVTAPTTAATLVVDPSAPGAGDAGHGTARRPFRTIGAAARAVRPGDTVLVRPGLYREAVVLTASGTAARPIRFAASPAGTVVVTGADPVTGWARVPGDAPLYRVPWRCEFNLGYNGPDGRPVEFQPEAAWDKNGPTWGRAEQVIADGRQLLPTADLADLRRAWPGKPGELPAPVPRVGGPFGGRFAVDTAAHALYVWLADGSDPNAHRMEATTRRRIFSGEKLSHVQVQGFVFRYGASFPQQDFAPVRLAGSDNRVEDCVIRDMAGSGVDVQGTLRGCIVEGCGLTGGCARVSDNGDAFLNENDLWQGNSWKPIDRSWEAGGVKLGVQRNGVFRHCLFRRNGGPGLWFDIACRRIAVRNCVFEENEGMGAFVEISHDIVIDGCLALRNNVGVVGNRGQGSDGGLMLAESPACALTHNTVVGNLDGLLLRESGPRTDGGDGLTYHAHDDTLVGNVSAGNERSQLAFWWFNDFFKHPADRKPGAVLYDPARQNMTIHGNLYDGGTTLAMYGIIFDKGDARAFQDLGAFTQATGFDSGSRVADPQFRDPAHDDYRFKPGSPALALQAGWSGAPANINRWMTQVLPPSRWPSAARLHRRLPVHGPM